MLWENFKMAFIAIRGAKLRSFLTMLGIIIGVAAVVAIIAIGDGVKANVSNQVAGLGSNLLTISSGAPSSAKGGGRPDVASSLGTSTLTLQDVSSVLKVPDVKTAAPISLISGIVSHASVVTSDNLVIATTPAYNEIRGTALTSGRFLDAQDAQADVLVLGSAAKTELFGSTNPIGATVIVRSTPMKVIGVLASTDNGSSLGGPSFDSAVFLPTGTAEAITGQSPQVYRILAQATSSQTINQASAGITAAIKINHGGQQDFSVLTQADLLSTFNTILNLLTTFIVSIASISLLVGGIGIMNIMLVSVTERTREIGIRKAIGASSGMVLTQFLIEAVVLSVMGGILGIGLAVLMAKAGGHAAKITPVFTPGAIFLAFGVSVGLGVIFGIAPAIKAARMRPIEALRYE